MQKDLLAGFLHLYHCFSCGSRTLVRLLDHFNGDSRQVVEASAQELNALGLKTEIIRKLKKPADARVSKDLAWAEQPGNHLLCYSDTAYPDLLREINDFPPLLYGRGDIKLIQNPQIAIVGSRLCTPGGAQNAMDFAAELASCGLTITSGMATGIDSHAHRGALQAGGTTIAVCATGLDRIYPARNIKLAEEIADNGLLLSEFPLGTAPVRQNFPQRNRIISGLSVATLVVEAAKRSGSLITARLAAEQGREVFAIPGSIHNPQTRGCHRLIRDGAKLVEQVSDITEELSSLFGFMLEQTDETRQRQDLQLEAEQLCLLEAIGYDPVNTDVLMRRSGLTIDKLSSMLVFLELNDFIRAAPGGCFTRV